MTATTAACTLVIVDDHQRFRSAARRVLEDGGFLVVGEAADGRSGVDAVRRLRPRVALLDVQLPDFDGFELARQLEGEPGGIRVVFLSSRDARQYTRRLERSGGAGFIQKAELSGAALHAVLNGDGSTGRWGERGRPGG